MFIVFIFLIVYFAGAGQFDFKTVCGPAISCEDSTSSECLKDMKSEISCLFGTYPAELVKELKRRPVVNYWATAFQSADDVARKNFFDSLAGEIPRFIMRVKYSATGSRAASKKYQLSDYSKKWQVATKKKDIVGMFNVLMEEVRELSELLKGKKGKSLDSFLNSYFLSDDSSGAGQNKRIITLLGDSKLFREMLKKYQDGTRFNFKQLGDLKTSIRDMQSRLNSLAVAPKEYREQDRKEKRDAADAAKKRFDKKGLCSTNQECLDDLKKRFDELVANFERSFGIIETRKLGIDLGDVKRVYDNLQTKQNAFPVDYDVDKLKRFAAGLGGIGSIDPKKYERALTPIAIQWQEVS